MSAQLRIQIYIHKYIYIFKVEHESEYIRETFSTDEQKKRATLYHCKFKFKFKHSMKYLTMFHYWANATKCQKSKSQNESVRMHRSQMKILWKQMNTICKHTFNANESTGSGNNKMSI